MTIELGYLNLCNMPVDAYATSPVPQEGEGSIIWSTLVKEVLRWDGTKWTVHGPNYLDATTRPSIRPSLLLAFSNGQSLDPRISFSRNSTALCYSKTGVLTTVAANVPRFDYDPVTLQCKGLLIEEARTNLLFYSNDISNAAWIKVNNGLASLPTVTANYGIAPDGTTTATRVQLKLNGGSTNNDYCRVYQPVPITSGTAYANSIYVRTTDGSTKTVQFRDDFSGITPIQNLIAINGNWTRISASATSTGTTCNAGSIWLRGGNNTSDNADILVWGGQLEAGAFATTLIPTTSSSVFRAAESATVSIGSWFNPVQGSLYAEADSSVTPTSPSMVAIDDGTTTQRLGIYFGVSGTNAGSYYRNSGTSYISGVVNVNPGNYIKASFGMASGNFTTVINGTITTAANGGVVPTGSTRLVIGGGDNPLNGHVKRIAYYPIKLSDQELLSLTV